MTNAGEARDPIRVLAVDDEPAIRDVYRLGLTQFGCRVRTASDGREALRAMILERFDVLVVDVRMDGMDGILFLQEALTIWPWAGVIIVSGHITADVSRRAAELGVVHVLHKPVALKALFSAVTEAAARSVIEAEAEPAGSALALMKNHLQLLSRINDRALATRSLLDALGEFGSELSGVLPADVVGILVAEEGEAALLFDVHTPVAPSFIDAVKTDILARFLSVSGRRIAPDGVQIRMAGRPLSDDATAAPGGILSVPIFLGDEIGGLLTLVGAARQQHTPADAALLYQAANNIAAVFTSLRRMHQVATRDPLTGLFNRMRLEEELERAWQDSRRYGPDLSVVVIDLDHFKTLNDTYGHATGDEILRGFGEIMRSAARSSDVLARYGGDEFVAILPRADEAAGRAFGERLRRRTDGHVFCPNTHRLGLTVSIGVAAATGASRPASASELLAQADKALYQSKRSGRNRICVWQGEGQAEADAASASTADAAQDVIIGTKRRARVIVVDDEPHVLRLVSAFLDREDCESFAFATAREAIDAVRKAPHHYDLIFTDIAMPGMGGIELLKEIATADDLIVKIVMTGYATVDNAVACLREGAFDFIEKPMDSGLFSAVTKRALEFRSLKVENARHHAHLERMVQQRSAQLTRTLQEVKESYRFTLEAFIAILDARETHTCRHSLRVRDLAVALARFMGLPEEPDVETIATGALLHDIGKIGIPDRILFRAGPLSTEDWVIMRSHAELGYRILSTGAYMRKSADIVLQHHEHFDGSGYPHGLKGEAICLGARIFTVVDAYDAMRSDRVYRGAMPADNVAEQIRAGRGTQFDPAVVDAFLAHRAELDAVFEQLNRDAAVLPDSAMPAYLTTPLAPSEPTA